MMCSAVRPPHLPSIPSHLMKLATLLARVTSTGDVVDVQGDVDRSIGAVSRDTRDVGAGDVFVAIEGARVDGHDLVGELTVAAVVVSRPVQARDGVTVVRVRDTKQALAQLAAAREGYPAEQLRMVGVTGTNGKTTITTLVDGALLALGRTAGRIGTAGNALRGVVEPAAFTTPEAPQLHRMLRRWADAGATSVAMEVSSIGLDQRRVDAVPFHVAAFTNLTQDHLDYHGTVEAYTEAKARLFTDLLRPVGGWPRAVLCVDDPAHEAMGAPSDRWTYGFGPSDWQIQQLGLGAEGMQLELLTPEGPLTLRSPMLGRHNAQNLACAAALLRTLDLSLADIARGLAAVDGVPGRLERVADPAGRLLVVDYAHSPDALEHALGTMRELTQGQLTVVFGCGGDRDKGKRPQMGAIAAARADRVVLTSDNPRSEDPEAILDDIAAGLPGPPWARFADRAVAIRHAIAAALPGDAVLIAGKGHETTQDIGGTKHPFDDRVQARRAVEAS